jgi:putative membrane protein
MSREKLGMAVWFSVFSVSFIWSGMAPYDRVTWLLEVSPAIAGLAVLVVTYKRFRLTGLAYWLILVHAVILMIGGRYTYARVPLFDLLKDTFDLSRNHYDKVGHLAQGFVPAILAREILLRKSPLVVGKWLSFIVVSICLAISAFYELIEWWVALAAGASAEAFLGTQGYVWDTQSDMAMALVGSILALLLLGRYHDTKLRALRR